MERTSNIAQGSPNLLLPQATISTSLGMKVALLPPIKPSAIEPGDHDHVRRSQFHLAKREEIILENLAPAAGSSQCRLFAPERVLQTHRATASGGQ